MRRPERGHTFKLAAFLYLSPFPPRRIKPENSWSPGHGGNNPNINSPGPKRLHTAVYEDAISRIKMRGIQLADNQDSGLRHIRLGGGRAGATIS